MYAERVQVVVDNDAYIKASAVAVFQAATGKCVCQVGPTLVDELRIQSWEPIDESSSRVTLVHRDMWDMAAFRGTMEDGYDVESVTSRRHPSGSVSEPAA